LLKVLELLVTLNKPNVFAFGIVAADQLARDAGRWLYIHDHVA
jgi:hypothetical protein